MRQRKEDEEWQKNSSDVVGTNLDSLVNLFITVGTEGEIGASSFQGGITVRFPCPNAMCAHLPRKRESQPGSCSLFVRSAATGIN